MHTVGGWSKEPERTGVGRGRSDEAALASLAACPGVVAAEMVVASAPAAVRHAVGIDGAVDVGTVRSERLTAILADVARLPAEGDVVRPGWETLRLELHSRGLDDAFVVPLARAGVPVGYVAVAGPDPLSPMVRAALDEFVATRTGEGAAEAPELLGVV